jgi:hypothetical protein
MRVRKKMHEGWVDEKALLPDKEHEELDKSVKPVHLMLVKVSPQ